ncbi:UDP-glucuronosyltransferase 2A1-like [Octopus vulgaris]|uniref:UDP-glucuronosyltransferase 2A1-like n=1 Tax=Octopus vulgaris TaxID=6645 RepID=A0AA36FNR1_OCTVU|nr:UDP-glucuronosyltransferase 2A1-like [Octopus vulgaris]
MTEKGYGLSLDIENFTPEELIEKINELIENKTYSEKIKRASEIFHSRPEYPAKKSARHIDHILKYGGEYLKSPCQGSRLYEFLMIDVLAPIFAFSGVGKCEVEGDILFMSKPTRIQDCNKESPGICGRNWETAV